MKTINRVQIQGTKERSTPHLREVMSARSESKSVSQSLIESEKLFRTLAEESPNMIFINKMGPVVYANKKCEEITGYTRDELCSPDFDFMMLIAPEFRELVKTSFTRHMRGEDVEAIEYALLTKLGKRVESIITTKLITYKHAPSILGVVTDITERKHAEDALKESEQKYRSLFEDSKDAVYETTRHGEFIEANKAMQDVTGYSREELCNMNVIQLYSDSSDRPKFQREIEANEAVKDYTVRFRKKDDIIIDCLLTSTVWRNTDGTIGGYRGIMRDVTETKRMAEKLKQSRDNLQVVLEGTIEAIGNISEVRDPYTAGHQKAVAKLASAIAKEMGLPEKKIEGLQVAAILHDIGKIAIPAEILSKPTTLSEIERGFLKDHPKTAYAILKTVKFPWPVCRIVLQHHERLDGSGYPEGLRGDEINMEARILAVADVVDAMTSHRPYRPALGIDKAIEEITQKRGILYDPVVVDACVKVLVPESTPIMRGD